MKGKQARAKGIAFERVVAAAFEQAGFTVRGLEAGGDHLAMRDSLEHWDRIVLHIECKRQERMQLTEWLRQQTRDCPPGADRVLVFQQSRQQAYAVVPLDQYLAMVVR